MSETSLEIVLSKKESYNLAIPFVESKQINPYYKMSISLLTVDTSEQAAQVFKVGTKCVRQGNKEEWIDLFSLTKPFLQKLATEAGIQFAPGAGDVVKVDENTWKASAFGALKLPDGTVRTSSNFKVIDLQTEEKKYRLAYVEKVATGIEDYRMAKAASERYKGEWEDTGRKNDKGYPIKRYVIDKSETSKFIEKSLLDAMTQLRANAPQKAATGAILRVIRDLTGIKGSYTVAELKKPFAVARMSFSPDYNDPVVKQMMLQQAMQSVGNLFGASMPVTQTIAIPDSSSVEDEVDIPVDIHEMESASSSKNQTSKSEQTNSSDVRLEDLWCDKCGDPISQKVWNYSVERFDRPLCYKCQKIVKTEEGRAN